MKHLLMAWWQRLAPSPFTLALIVAVVAASLLPARGGVALGFDRATDLGIALLFFLHGAKLSRASVLGAVGHWRLHLLVLAFTFVVFPLLGLALSPLQNTWLTPELYLGVLFLCLLPSTVQSSIAFTSIARGNVPAAVVSASLSSVLGIFITPLLVGVLMARSGTMEAPLHGITAIVVQLLLPFVAGHLLRPWIGRFVDAHRRLLHAVDQGTILLVVYTAFSASVVEGLWHKTPIDALLAIVAVSAVLLAVVMPMTAWAARRMGFSRADRIAIVFCGSKKSMASGLPMAKILFAGSTGLGALVLPLMVFHQLQLMVCAVIAQRYAQASQALADQGPA